MATRSETIEAIMRINRSACAEFLGEFSSDDLVHYLDRLNSLPKPAAPAAKPDERSPGASALRSASRATIKSNPLRFMPDTSAV